MSVRFGLIADTHIPGSAWELSPQVADAFQGVDAILHGGDITTAEVLDWLECIAPVWAAEGNNDQAIGRDRRVKNTHTFGVASFRIGLIHEFEPREPLKRQVWFHFGQPMDIVVFGHTHLDAAEVKDGLLLVNPGSPTCPWPWSTPKGTVGILEINGQGAQAQIFQLHESNGLVLLKSASLRGPTDR